MAKALVTGVAGFIGSTLSDTLLGQGKDVIGIDCFTDYYERSTKEKNLENSKANENFNFLEIDLSEAELSDAFKEVDVVYHLAAQPGVRYSWENFDVYLKNNIKATQRVLEAAKESGSRVIFASSSSVYG
ncbi:MAG: GDP-mannose 4,6-dehydratase, partial [archaeon]|nr:GDP-mannose 4,6-dehydratase [archaeon]